jgi:hypothetical protein
LAPAFLLRDKTKNPALAAGFFVARAKNNMAPARLPLRFRHSARDNAVHGPTTVEDRRNPRNLLTG